MPYTTVSTVILCDYCIWPVFPLLLDVPLLEQKWNLPTGTTSPEAPSVVFPLSYRPLVSTSAPGSPAPIWESSWLSDKRLFIWESTGPPALSRLPWLDPGSESWNVSSQSIDVRLRSSDVSVSCNRFWLSSSPPRPPIWVSMGICLIRAGFPGV